MRSFWRSCFSFADQHCKSNQHRVGNAYVYPSKYVNDEEGVSILKEQMEGEPNGEPNFFSWKTGLRKKSWNKSCIAKGVSAGFVKPLESTGLHLIQSAVGLSCYSQFDHNGDPEY